jgi:lipoprotein-anchoring transpeptidase ErfK/SrfK
MSAGKHRFLGTTIFSSRILRVALVAVAGLAGTASSHAAVFWSDDDPMVMSQPIEPAPQPRPKRPRRTAYKLEKPPKETRKPVGPLVIAISIDRQTLKMYDANGLFAETPVSTGMVGHSTPMGVFSVIQKNKWHRSNIYSDAPMPYMQRITWSGIAMHAGVLPGHPASHGCIRMPMAFAARMWGWTRMGARVVIAPGELSPSDISHPLLIAHKTMPVPMAAAKPDDATPVAKAAVPVAEASHALSSASLELKPTVDTDKARTASEIRRDQTQTADAKSAMTPTATMSDASSGKTDDKKIFTRRDVDDAVAKSVELPNSAAKLLESVPTEAIKAATIDAIAGLPDARAQETKPADADKATTAAEPAPKRGGQIAVLISRKDGKLYVRQNYAPLFEAPVAITASDRPLGTHVFTARADKDDANAFHWSVVSLPAARRAERGNEDDNATRRRRSAGAIEMKPIPLPDSAAEALDRLTIPEDAMARIAEYIAGGSSIIVSDLGIATGGETGEGTEFVVPLR